MTSRLRKVLLLAAIAIAMAIAYRPGYLQLQSMKQKLAAAESEHERLQAEHDELAKRAQALQSDPLAIEREARQRLGLVRPGEVVYKFPKDESELESQ